MPKNKDIIVVIPARGGSRSIPKKNIINFNGYPIIAYSIAVAALSKYISRIIVSTDSEEIAEIAKKYGAEVPFIRPKKFATDKSGDFEVFNHMVNWLKKEEKYLPNYLVHLRPTTPLRDPKIVDNAIEMFTKDEIATSLRSGYEIRESPYKCFVIKNNFFTGFSKKKNKVDYSNLPRQFFSPVYQPDGYVDIVKSEIIIKKKNLHGYKIRPFLTPNIGELDNLEDINFIDFVFRRNNYKIYDYLKKNFKPIK